MGTNAKVYFRLKVEQSHELDATSCSKPRDFEVRGKAGHELDATSCSKPRDFEVRGKAGWGIRPFVTSFLKAKTFRHFVPQGKDLSSLRSSRHGPNEPQEQQPLVIKLGDLK
ncbi:Uncharacterized protein HZ326_27853 [Fusarium oxysporum f. sp. albedinis]|nr:Uncharacterized protein HZ326_27853 [Fusarium oxysporum f. sp. albedinis]